MAAIRIIDDWLRCPAAPASHWRSVMVVAEKWGEQRVLMRAYADSRDQTRPTIMLHSVELAIGPAGLDANGPWGIHVGDNADGRAQEIKHHFESSAKRLAGSKGNPPRLLDEGSTFDREPTGSWGEGAPRLPPSRPELGNQIASAPAPIVPRSAAQAQTQLEGLNDDTMPEVRPPGWPDEPVDSETIQAPGHEDEPDDDWDKPAPTPQRSNRTTHLERSSPSLEPARPPPASASARASRHHTSPAVDYVAPPSAARVGSSHHATYVPHAHAALHKVSQHAHPQAPLATAPSNPGLRLAPLPRGRDRTSPMPIGRTALGYASGAGAQSAVIRLGLLPQVSARLGWMVDRVVPGDFQIDSRERNVLNALGQADLLSARAIGQLVNVTDAVAWMESLTRKLETYGLDLVEPAEPDGGEPTYRLRR